MSTEKGKNKGGSEQTDQRLVSGTLLLAQPWLREPVFSRSVIMLVDTETENGEKGSMGLVLNHPSPITLDEVVPAVDSDNVINIHIGGPVELERLFMLHRLPEYFNGSVYIGDELYLGGTVEEIVEYIKENGYDPKKMRFFMGYAGWDNGQLEKELQEGTWAVNSNVETSDLLDGNGITYWRREIEKLGEPYRHWLLVPEDSSMN